jgi:NADP-dependent 3-hydroxy acid dehydrogenase YdfG
VIELEKNFVPVVWVTGATKGIGLAVANAFSVIGCKVIITGRNKFQLEINAGKIIDQGGYALPMVCDVTSETSVRSVMATITKKLGTVDVLVNNAGVTVFESFEKTTVKEFDQIVDTNLRGYFLCTKSVLTSMLKQKKGHIFNIHSVSATTTFLNSSVYSASKAGSLALSKSLRAEVRKKGIRVIDVLPGAVETEMWDKNSRKKFHSKMMQPEDVADAIVSVYCQPQRMTTDEIVLRPIEGDL